MSVSWHSFDLRSGRRGPRVATRELGTIQRIIGEPTGVDLSTDCTVPDWDSSTLPGRTMLVALGEEERILWGGMVLRRVSGPEEWVSVQTATLEHYLERRFVGDLTFTGVDQASIAAGLIGNVAVDGIDLTVDAPASGTLRDRTYADDEDKTALSVLTELAGVEGGPEFTVDLEWDSEDHTVLRKVFRVRNRIGSAAAFPTQWNLPGCLTGFEYVEDFSEGFGANDVLASSSGESDSRPESAHQVSADLLAAGWAKFEERFTPSTSITHIPTLNAHAQARLALRRNGLAQLKVSAQASVAPRLGVDWWLGDDIGVNLTCPRFPARLDSDGGQIPGLSQTMRVVGWKHDLDADTLEPTIWDGGQ